MAEVIIDFHTHIFSHEVIAGREGLCNSDICFSTLYSNPAASIMTADDLLRSMDENGIEKAVIQNIGWCSHNLCVHSNEYILESVAKYPGRLIGFCAVQPAHVEESILEVERCHAAGARGIGELRPDLQVLDMANPEPVRYLIQKIADLGMLLSLHTSEPVGHEYPGKGTVWPGLTYKFISTFPDARLILAHLGGGLPFYHFMPEVEKAASRVYYDTAAAPFLYRPDIYPALLAAAGEKKILFGSDWPLVGHARAIEHLKRAGLPAQSEVLILGDNAAGLLGISGI